MKSRTLGRVALIGACCALMTVSAFADGIISGVVIDGFTGQPVRGATLKVDGTNHEIQSDLGGAFQYGLPAGTYSVTVSRDGYDAQKVTGVAVTDDGVSDFAVVLLPATDVPEGVFEGEAVDAGGSSGVFAGEITVEAEAETSTEAALLSARKNAAMISDSIGTQEMKKNTGSDAAQAVKRVTGVSLQENKYVFVRGLGERYSNTQVNGSKIPTTEFEKKVVPLDLFPSNLIDKIQISKSYTADKPGDFAAGLVEMDTLDFPVAPTFNIGMGVSHNQYATGEPFGEYAGGLSFSGSGGQGLPDGIPDESLIRISPITGEGFTTEELQEYGRMLIGQWTANTGDTGSPWSTTGNDAPLGNNFNIGYGATFGRFGMVLSGTHSHDYSAHEEERNFYRLSEYTDSGVSPLHTFDFDYNTETVKRGIVANFAYRFSGNHHIKLRNMLTNLATSETSFQEGYYSDFDADIRDYKVDYKEQDVQTFQLTGEHYFEAGALGGLLEWRAALSEATTGQDLRLTNYADRLGDGSYVLTDNAQSGFMYYNDLTDKLNDYGVDWTSFLTGEAWHGSIKGGVHYTFSDRTFDGRRLRYQPRETYGLDLTESPEDLFTYDNINPYGFEVEEITRPTDSYDAEQTVGAAYGLFDWNRNKWRVIAGLRYEDSQIDVITLDRQNPELDPILTNLGDQDFMPSLGVVYRLSGDQNLRLSASQTVNRPEFRELAPYRFTSIAGGFEATGNPDLISAGIQSFDARWEWFPGPTDVIAASVFYKDFADPIEPILIQSVARVMTFQNADSARNMGLELEFRKTFEPFTVILNYAYIDSQITLAEGSIQTNAERPLVGQPDHVGNVVLEWLNASTSTNLRLLYNYSGEQVAFAGANGLPDVMELPRSTFGFAFIQGFSLFDMDWNVKLSGENLTDSEWEFTQGGEVWRLWNPGRKFGLSVGLTVF